MKQGSSAMLIGLAIQSVRIAMAASPLPRNMPLIGNSITMARLPPSQIAAQDDARVRGPRLNHLGRGVHEFEQSRGECETHDAHEDGEHGAGADPLHGS